MKNEEPLKSAIMLKLNEEFQKKADDIYNKDDANKYGFHLYQLIHEFNQKIKAVLEDESR